MPESTFALTLNDTFALTEEQRIAPEFAAFISVSALNTTPYENMKMPRHESFYGYAQLMAGAYVIETIQISYVNQRIFYQYMDTSLIYDAIGCAVQALDGSPAIIFPRRRDLTAIRVRCAPWAELNMTVRWIPLDSVCGNGIAEPRDGQGNPPDPKNDRESPDDQPDETESDGFDETGSDGVDPDAPKPGAQGLQGAWNWDVLYSAPFDGIGTNTAPGFEDQVPGQIDLAPLGGCTEPRLGFTLDGILVTETDNCDSTILNVAPPYFTR